MMLGWAARTPNSPSLKEALDRDRVLRLLAAQHLDGGLPLLGVLRAVDEGGAALPDVREQAVARDGPTDQVILAHEGSLGNPVKLPPSRNPGKAAWCRARCAARLLCILSQTLTPRELTCTYVRPRFRVLHARCRAGAPPDGRGGRLWAGVGWGRRRGPASPAPKPRADRHRADAQSDLFNLTALYQRMGRIAGGNPLPFVGQTAFFAGRGRLHRRHAGPVARQRALAFQRTGRDFVARYRVEIGFQRPGALPLRYAREEAITVATYQETQRADEAVVLQQTFLLPPGTYQLSVTIRDPGIDLVQPAQMPLAVPAFAPGSYSAPILVYSSTPRSDVWAEPAVLLNPRGMVAHGGESLNVVVEGYGLTGPDPDSGGDARRAGSGPDEAGPRVLGRQGRGVPGDPAARRRPPRWAASPSRSGSPAARSGWSRWCRSRARGS